MSHGKATTIEATYRIVTPMFCSGADPDSAELRLASFKGALRFWWRALMWGNVTDQAELRRREAELFGASDTGSARVRLRLVRAELGRTLKAQAQLSTRQTKGIAYLGHGVMNFRSILERPAIENGEFTVECRLSPFMQSGQIREVRNALVVLGACGGLGSRSRNGFGSLTLTSLVHSDQPHASVNNALAPVLNVPHNDAMPEWTAFSKQSRIVMIEGSRDPLDTQNSIGSRFSLFRLWQGDEESSTFPADHNSMHAYLKAGSRLEVPPQRIAFGLPHNYFFRSLSETRQQRKRFVKAEITPERKNGKMDHSRRASPLFIHVESNVNAACRIVLTFLPARFLPAGELVTITDTSNDQSRRRTHFPPISIKLSNDGFYAPVTRFLDSMVGEHGVQEVKIG